MALTEAQFLKHDFPVQGRHRNWNHSYFKSPRFQIACGLDLKSLAIWAPKFWEWKGYSQRKSQKSGAFSDVGTPATVSWYNWEQHRDTNWWCTSGVSGGSLQGGASFKAEKAHFAAWNKGPEKHNNEVKLRPPLCRSMKCTHYFQPTTGLALLQTYYDTNGRCIAVLSKQYRGQGSMWLSW